jgi:hypothetical protein
MRADLSPRSLFQLANHWQSSAIIGNHRQSMAINGNQWQSMAINVLEPELLLELADGHVRA